MQNNKGAIKIIFHDLKDKYLFEIDDNGPGIPAEELNTLFDWIYTVKKSALDNSYSDLPLVKRLLTKMNGGILVQSEIGKGSSFVFSVPKG